MSLTQASDTDIIQVKITSSDKLTKNGDQAMEGVSLTSEAGSTGSGGGGGGNGTITAPAPLQDPAVLMVRETTTTTTNVSGNGNANGTTVVIRYSREQLLRLRDVPAAKKRPDFLNTSDTSSLSIFDPDRWNFDKRKPSSGVSSAPLDGDASDQQPRPNRRSTADPRERLRKECGGGGDGIVLSPQRRSFNSGCFVPAGRGSSQTGGGSGQVGGAGGGGTVRAHSPSGPKTASDGHLGLREIQSGGPPSTGNRRIGSGRILRDSWDFPDKQSEGGDEYGTSKFERRSFGGGFDRDRDGKDGRRNHSRFDRRKISETREQEEPEWFSSGPISQNDTIELRGFDDEKPVSKKNLRRSDKWLKKKDSQQGSNEEIAGNAPSALQVNAEESEKIKDDNESKSSTDSKKEAEKDKKRDSKDTAANEQGFNFDEILKCESIAGLLPNGVGGDGDNQAKSRFSRWFKQESPEKQPQSNATTGIGGSSRHSSLHSEDDHHLIIKDLLKDISDPVGGSSGGPPGDSDAYFAPISPASSTPMTFGVAGNRQSQPTQLQQQQGLSIMELLRAGGGGASAVGNKVSSQQQSQPHPRVDMLKQPSLSGKILSLDELEAKIRQNAAEVSSSIPQKHQQQQQPLKPDEDMTVAFKKLLAQAQSGGHPVTANGPMNKTQPMSLLEMLNHSQQQDEAARLAAAAAAVAAATHQHHPTPAHHSMMGGPASPAAAPSAPSAASSQMNPLHHLSTVSELTLKLQQAQQYHQQHQQKQQMEMFNKLINAATSAGQMRLSPLQHELGPQQSRELLNRPEAQAILQALHQRIPSPRELQVHTQNILQRALIKKKLEEQQENYRKKQELQQQQRERGTSPANPAMSTCGNNNNVQPSNVSTVTKSVAAPSPTPTLAFTPTSVLRKMTADKDDLSKETGKIGQETVIGNGKMQGVMQPQGRPLTGVRPQPPTTQQQLQQQQQQQWGMQFNAVKQPVGRPIVKANNNYQSQGPQEFFNQHQQQRIFNQAMQAAVAAQQSQNQQLDAVRKQVGTGGQYPYHQTTNQQFPQQQQQLTSQQLRAQHQHRPSNQQSTQQGNGSNSWQQFFNSSQQSQASGASSRPSVTMTTSTSSMGNRGSGAISPATGNQLARWFSPDLLERARGGELPSTAGLAQHALSLEEIERQTAPPVHN